MSTKLQSIFAHPNGEPLFTRRLIELGISESLIQKYKQSGWLEPLGGGAWKKFGDKLGWLQSFESWRQLSLTSLHIGGLTALELHGRSHYLRKNHAIVFFGAKSEKLPLWFRKYQFEVKFRVVATEWLYNAIGIKAFISPGGVTTSVSTPERAFLEFLYDVPRHNDCVEAFHILQGLATLRPKLLQELLNASSSVKVNRLFFVMSKKVGHSWVRRINMDQVQLGKGPRVIAPNGKFNSEFQIKIPLELL